MHVHVAIIYYTHVYYVTHIHVRKYIHVTLGVYAERRL